MVLHMFRYDSITDFNSIYAQSTNTMNKHRRQQWINMDMDMSVWESNRTQENSNEND